MSTQEIHVRTHTIQGSGCKDMKIPGPQDIGVLLRAMYRNWQEQTRNFPLSAACYSIELGLGGTYVWNDGRLRGEMRERVCWAATGIMAMLASHSIGTDHLCDERQKDPGKLNTVKLVV
jgi:hypothetical protein